MKNLRLSDDKKSIVHNILVALDKLKCAADGSPALEDFQEPLTLFSAQCKISVAHRVFANTHNAYATLLKLVNKVQVSNNNC